MENFVKKISAKNFDDYVHLEFIKFSKGAFPNKYLLNAKKQKDKWVVKTGAEFANFLVRNSLEKANGKISVKGAIISTSDLRNEVKFPIEHVKQFMGVKQLVINTEIDSKELVGLMEKFPKTFYALSFVIPGYELKIKAKAPKSAKPSTSDKEVVADFCSLKTTDKNIINDLFFETPDFREISINHTLKINEITLPKGEKDPVKIREMAKRKGVLVRKIKVDEKEIIKEYSFEA